MSIERMHFYTMSFPATQCMEILKRIQHVEVYPQEARKIVQNVKGVSIYQLDNPYLPLLEETIKLMDTLVLEKVCNKPKHEFQLETSKEFLKEVSTPVEKIDLVLEQLYKEIEENKQALFLLKQLEKQNLDIDDLKSSHYVHCYVGKIPSSKKGTLKHFLSTTFVCEELLEQDGYLWLVYLCLEKDQKSVSNIFQGLLFEEIYLPDFLHGTFKDAYTSLQETATAMEAHVVRILERKEGLRNQYFDHIGQLYSFLKYYNDLIENAKCLVDFETYVSIYAYSNKTLEEIKELDSSMSVIEIPVDMYESKGIEAPILFHNHWFISPFENFVRVRPNDILELSLPIALVFAILGTVVLKSVVLGTSMIVIGMLLMKQQFGKMLCFTGIYTVLSGVIHVVSSNQSPLDISGLGESVAIFIGIVMIVKIVGTAFMSVVRFKVRRKQSGYS